LFGGSSIGTETLSSSSNKFAAFVEDAVGMGASALGSTIEIGSDEEDNEDDGAAAEKERLVRRLSMLPVRPAHSLGCLR
jgi:DhnA family fructose-bisphosphate aldolase class Ia